MKYNLESFSSRSVYTEVSQESHFSILLINKNVCIIIVLVDALLDWIDSIIIVFVPILCFRKFRVGDEVPTDQTTPVIRNSNKIVSNTRVPM